MAFRFTKKNVEETLKLNEGFKTTTNYKSRNASISTDYEIKKGKLLFHETGRAPFGKVDNSGENDYAATQRFLRRFKDKLKLPE